MSTATMATSFPCAGCAGLVRFKTQDQLDEHTRAVHPPDPMADLPPAPLLQRTVIRVKEANTVATKPNKADPDNCQVCRRLGEKCKRHGGVAHSTSYQGKGVKVSPKTLAKQNQQHKARREAKNGPKHALAFKGRTMLAAAIKQIETETKAMVTILDNARALAKLVG